MRLPSSPVLGRIVLAVGAAFLLMMVTGTLWTIYTHTELVRQEQERAVLMIAAGLGNAVAREVVTGDYRALEQRLRQTLASPDVRSAMVADLDGRVLASAQRGGSGDGINVLFGGATVQLPAADHLVSTDAGQVSTGWYRIDVGVPVGWVRVETTNRHLLDVNARVRRNTIYLMLFGTLVAVALVAEALLRTSNRLRARESEVARKESRLSDMAYFDRLTGLPNRVLLLDRLEQAIARTRREHNLLGVCFIDLDGFKAVNDQFGHKTGDLMLQVVGQRLQAAVRDGDTAARYGGDEFVLLLDGLNGSEECESILQRLLGLVSEPYELSGRTHSISASIGITLFPGDHGGAEALIGHADQAMYVAKQQGGARFVFHVAAVQSAGA